MYNKAENFLYHFIQNSKNKYALHIHEKFSNATIS